MMLKKVHFRTQEFTQEKWKKILIYKTAQIILLKKVFYSLIVVSHIYRVRANQYVSIAEISAGDIIAISGLKNTKAGDTLIENGSKRFVL